MSSYSEIALTIAELVERKQKMYGNSFDHAGEIMRILYPIGISLDQLESALTVVRVIDKLHRIANGDQGDESAWSDICGYSILELRKNARETR